MATRHSKEYVWGLALDDNQRKEVASALPEGVGLETGSIEDLRHLENRDDEPPLAVLIDGSKWFTLDDETRANISGPGSSPLVVMLDADALIERQPARAVFRHQFSGILPRPVTAVELQEVVDSCRQTRSLFQDIYHMTQEISLERELLGRKIDQLDFLNKAILKVGESLETETILKIVGGEVDKFMAVEGLFCTLWENEGPEMLRAELFVPGRGAKTGGEDLAGWLLAESERLARRPVQSYQVNPVKGLPLKGETLADPANIITLKLRIGGGVHGLLVIVSKEASHLGRDRMSTLESLAGHVSLALSNSLKYRKVSNQAIFDGLTRIYNRRHFDIRLMEELKRHQRHGQDLSIMMMDLDFFKEINDIYGHLAGDMVLREMGRIIRGSLRESDVAARYGGEEFVVLLPQTREEQAWKLAQRIRKNVAKTHFVFEGREFRVTTSIGIASVKPGSLQQASEFMSEVDKALYMAKRNGRNMVCSSAMLEEDAVLN